MSGRKKDVAIANFITKTGVMDCGRAIQRLTNGSFYKDSNKTRPHQKKRVVIFANGPLLKTIPFPEIQTTNMAFVQETTLIASWSWSCTPLLITLIMSFFSNGTPVGPGMYLLQ